MDMGGNVREWVDTTYEAYPGGKAMEDTSGVVNRGGSWVMDADQFSTAHTRIADSPETQRSDIGFRCAADLWQM
jgi:formylglycine-generating enzyme required for sulfatase activity